MADESGTTYGPAQSRRTRLPINFDPSYQNAGLYTPPSQVDQILAAIPIIRNLVNTQGSIKVNPANTSDVDRTIRHEDIHAILNPANQSGQLDQLNAQNPFYAKIVNQLGNRTNLMSSDPSGVSQEAPAYAGSKEFPEVGIDNPLSQAYYNNLVQQFQKLDPKTAQALTSMQQGAPQQ